MVSLRNQTPQPATAPRGKEVMSIRVSPIPKRKPMYKPERIKNKIDEN